MPFFIKNTGIKIKGNFLLFALLLLSRLLVGAGDSHIVLVSFSDLYYHSELEKAAFEDWFVKGNKDYTAMLMVIDSSLTNKDLDHLRSLYKSHLDRFQNKKFKRLNGKGKIKKLYKYIPENFFAKYELSTCFNDIFSSGHYNYVSASALYALFCHDLEIPFVLRETPIHIYMVTYPSEHDIIIETTDPENRFYKYDYRTKKNYVDHLVSLGLISANDIMNEEVEEIFNEYFYTKDDITFSQLIGIQYFYLAAQKLDEKQPVKAFELLEKAYMFYPSVKLEFVLYTALSSIVGGTDYIDLGDLQYLARLPRYRNFGVSNELIVEEFKRALHNNIHEYGIDKSFVKAYGAFVSGIGDSALVHDVTFAFNYELGRYYLSTGNLDEGAVYIENAFENNRDNADALSLLIAATAIKIKDKNEDEILKILNHYLQKFPSLINNELYHALLLEAYLLKATKDFYQKQIEEGLSLLSDFEKSFEANPLLPVSKSLIVEAYATAGVYYFRQGENNQSKKFLLQGLRYVPESNELKLRLQSF